MQKVKKGDYVVRKSHKEDMLFIIDKIIKLANGKQIAILKGITIRLVADAPLEDLILAEKSEIEENIKSLIQKIENNDINIEKQQRVQKKIQTGLILHLDGDKKYSEKSLRYYRKMGLRAIVRNVPENKQPKVVYKLLCYYNPDILIITGHGGNIYTRKLNILANKNNLKIIKPHGIYEFRGLTKKTKYDKIFMSTKKHQIPQMGKHRRSKNDKKRVREAV